MSQHKNKVALINRRYLRIKVFQALYSYYRSEDKDAQAHERELFESVNHLYDLYLHLVALIMKMQGVALEIQEANKRKQLPTQEDLNPNTRFVENRVFDMLKENTTLIHIIEKAKISWEEEHDDLRKIFKQFKTEDAFILYMSREESNMELDKEILLTLFQEKLGLNTILHSALEEKNIYWQDDLPFAAVGFMKFIKALPASSSPNDKILPDLYKNKTEDVKFAKDLFKKCIDNGREYEELIATKAVNWETDRIALIDMLLMKMGLTELEHCSDIPVKVTLNEYIELAKMYSTPKSKVFINGVLDKIVADFKREERIKKEGRGLLE